MTRETFNQGFAMMLAVYHNQREKIPAEEREVYWHLFQNIEDAKFMAAVHECLGDCVFFPGPAEITARLFPPKLERIHPRSAHERTVSPGEQLVMHNREVHMLMDARRKEIA